MKQMIPYGILAVATALMVWCLVNMSRDIAEATRRIWPAETLMPEGLELLQRYGMFLFLIPITAVFLMFLGRRVQIVNSPTVIAIFAAMAMALLVFAGLMLVTPIVSHGGYIGIGK